MYATKEECFHEHEGHCWTSDGVSLQMSNITVVHEWCKHCPARRKKTSRAPWTIEEY